MIINCIQIEGWRVGAFVGASVGHSQGTSVKLGSVTGSTVVHKIKPTGWEEIKRRKNVITEDMQMIRKVKKKRIQMWKKSSVEWASEEVRRVLFTRTKGIGFKKFFTHDIIVEQVAPDHLHEQGHTNLDEPDVAGYPRQTYFFYRGVAAPNTTTISTFLLWVNVSCNCRRRRKDVTLPICPSLFLWGSCDLYEDRTHVFRVTITVLYTHLS